MDTKEDCVEYESGESICAPQIQDILVEKEIIHHGYGVKIFNRNDIALLRLASPFVRQG